MAPLFYERDSDGIPPGWVERIRHTFRSLGPKVQAERMVREYASTLYVPAAMASRRLADGEGFAPARELAAWKQRVVRAWPQVRIEHLEAEAAGQALGSALTVRVSVALGELTPDDVTVEAVYGRPDDADEIVSPAYAVLARGDDPPQTPPAVLARGDDPPQTPPAVSPGGTHPPGPPLGEEPSPPDPLGPPTGGNGRLSGLVRYSGEVPLDQPGPFGYTVRVLPNHPLLDSRAELGLVTYPQAPSGMTNGDLR